MSCSGVFGCCMLTWCVCIFVDALEVILQFSLPPTLFFVLFILFILFLLILFLAPTSSFRLFCEGCFSHCLSSSCDCNDPLFHLALLYFNLSLASAVCLPFGSQLSSLFAALTNPYCVTLEHNGRV